MSVLISISDLEALTHSLSMRSDQADKVAYLTATRAIWNEVVIPAEFRLFNTNNDYLQELWDVFHAEQEKNFQSAIANADNGEIMTASDFYFTQSMAHFIHSAPHDSYKNSVSMTITEKEEVQRWVEQSLARAARRDELEAAKVHQTEQVETQRGWFSKVMDYLTGSK